MESLKRWPRPALCLMCWFAHVWHIGSGSLQFWQKCVAAFSVFLNSHGSHGIYFVSPCVPNSCKSWQISWSWFLRFRFQTCRVAHLSHVGSWSWHIKQKLVASLSFLSIAQVVHLSGLSLSEHISCALLTLFSLIKFSMS